MSDEGPHGRVEPVPGGKLDCEALGQVAGKDAGRVELLALGKDALDLILSGRTLHAEDAHTLGLIGHVHSVDTFDAEVNAYAGTLASHSGAVLRLAKRAVADTAAVSVQEALREADRIYLEDLMSLHDAHEGLAAFLEKRTPAWRDA